MATITRTTTFEIETCCSCGVQFGMPTDLKHRRVNDHASFFCPNGHGQHYTGPTDAQKAKAEAEALRSQLAGAQQTAKYLRDENRRERERVEAARRSASAHKGAHTRTKNRVAAGVCPCCNRTFQDLARHMAGQHPTFSQD